MSGQFWDTSSLSENDFGDDDYSDAIPDIPEGGIDEGIYDEGDFSGPVAASTTSNILGTAIGGTAASMTARPGASFPTAHSYQATGPQVGAAFVARDGNGFYLTVPPEGAAAIFEALQGAMQEIAQLATNGLKPAKFATILAFNMTPNPSPRGQNSPVGFLTLANRGAIKTEASAQVPKSNVVTQVMQQQQTPNTMANAMGIISSSTVTAAPRTAVTTQQAAARTVAPTPNSGIVSLINMG